MLLGSGGLTALVPRNLWHSIGGQHHPHEYVPSFMILIWPISPFVPAARILCTYSGEAAVFQSSTFEDNPNLPTPFPESWVSSSCTNWHYTSPEPGKHTLSGAFVMHTLWFCRMAVEPFRNPFSNSFAQML